VFCRLWFRELDDFCEDSKGGRGGGQLSKLQRAFTEKDGDRREDRIRGDPTAGPVVGPAQVSQSRNTRGQLSKSETGATRRRYRYKSALTTWRGEKKAQVRIYNISKLDGREKNLYYLANHRHPK